MKPVVLAFALVLAPTVLASRDTGAETGSETKSEVSSSIEGTVVKSTTGQPLKRAMVTAQRIGGFTGVVGAVNDEQRSTRTDSTGHFILRDLPPGEYNVWVNRDGYLGQAYGQETPRGSGKTLTLGLGQVKRDLLFQLVPTGAVVGRVYDEDGEPMSGVTVQALRYSYFNGARQLNGVMGTTSNDLGEYRMPGLAAEKYYVSATYLSTDPGLDTASEAYAPVYYPGTNDLGGAVPVDVQAGDETHVDFNLTPVPAVRIRGRILNAELSKPGVGVNVMLMRHQVGWSFSQGQTYIDAAQGSFEIRNVPPGSYFIMAQLFDGAKGKQYYARQPLEVGNADVDGLGLAPGPGLEIRGHLRIEGKAQLKFMDGANQVDLNGLQVSLQPRDQMPIGVQPASVGADGSFVIKDVPGGNYTLGLCCMPQDFYLKAAHLGSDDVLEQGLNLEQTPPPGQLDLVIGTAGGRIEGVVTSDQKPVSEAMAVLVPDANRRDQTRLYFPATTDPHGGFSIGSVPPGDYTLFAWKKIDDGAYYDPDFLASYEGRGKSVRVDEGSKLKIQVELIPPANP